MMKQMKSLATMVVVLLAALVMGACSSSSDDDGSDKSNWHLMWKAQYLEYNIEQNNLGITPQKLEDDVTASMSSYNEKLNAEQGYAESEIKAAILTCKQKWIDKGWYPYIKNIYFNIGVFDMMSQRLSTYLTWRCGTDFDQTEN